MQTKEEKKEYRKEYEQRPEVKAKIKEYEQRPEVKARRKEWSKKNKDKINARKKKYRENNKEKIAKRQKEHHSKPEVKEKRKEYNQRSKVKAKRKEYLNRPEVKKRTKERKIEYKKMIISGCEKIMKEWAKLYKDLFRTENPSWFRQLIKEYYNESIKKLKKEKVNLYFIEHSDKVAKGQITNEMIVSAKNRKINEFIETGGRDVISSPFREDKHFSFNVKGTYYFDHATGENGDVINFVMRLNSLDFVSAIKFLNNV